jgi:hypothetical protein
MAAVTAQILIGNPHRNDGGLRAIDKIEVSEGGRPALNLSVRGSGEDRMMRRTFTWIPSLEHAMDDAILMIAIHVMKVPEILELVNQINPGLTGSRVEIYEDISSEDRERLYRACQELEGLPKIIATIYRGSLLKRSASNLKHYKMDAEICVSVFCREYSHWTQEVHVYGDPDFTDLPLP